MALIVKNVTLPAMYTTASHTTTCTDRSWTYYEHLMDKAPIKIGYYRIHSMDFDSKAQYSNIIHVAGEGVVGDISVYIIEEFNLAFGLDSKN